MEDYNCTLYLPNSKERVFEAISSEVSLWWGKTDVSKTKADSVFKVSWGEPWYQFRVTDFEEGRHMTWLCIDANQIIKGLEGIQKEWVGTSIHWSVESTGENTSILHFKHEGLTPKLICFDFCSSTWNMFLKDRLVSFLGAY